MGLKVDVEALPREFSEKLRRGKVDLENPATTLALLRLDAIVGVKGSFDEQGRLASVGTRCSHCHSTVDDSLLPGVGRRLDGWANRDLDVGAIIALAPASSTGDSMTRVLGQPARLDFVLLGVGPDGHVASLFPGHAVLSDDRRMVVPVVDAPKSPARRLTLTLPRLAGAERVVVIAMGESKAGAMQESIEHPDSTLPVALMLQRAERSLVLLDEAAASRMSRRRC